jgi:hypothetical protein
MCLLDAESVTHPEHVVAEAAQPSRGVDGGRLAVPGTAQVDGDRPDRVWQVEHERLPEKARRHVAVEEQDDGAAFLSRVRECWRRAAVSHRFSL